MTGEHPLELKLEGRSRRHKKVYPMYENAEGYKIYPGRNVDTLAYEWKVRKFISINYIGFS